MSAFAAPRSILVAFHPSLARAGELAESLAAQARAGGVSAEVAPLTDSSVQNGDAFMERLRGAGLLICVGGDGTMLHASAYACREGIPVFGVRMGRLGFLTESVEANVAADLARVLAGEARLEPRTMVQVHVGESEPLHALNDVVIGRATLGRTISVEARIDGVLLAEYRADAIVIATATGSTGYALSVGGPILHPSSTEMILVPVAPHLTRANALVLPGEARLRLSVERGYEAVLGVDGLHHRPVGSGSVVEITRSPRTVDFVRLGPETEFYQNLAVRLGWLRLDHVLDTPGQ
ncbi:MAG: NAD(+)/NADH kinase [Chloroflexi bacterium]|nr:NAD(+)/NADH kinase [Chloroflexota bacterium]MDA1240969.1 NAD(+)/NADH kinase [Chloroflexota bacterium]MQC48263.1 NAD(+)/NADH kinase [Chloroflexota bacterium]